MQALTIILEQREPTFPDVDPGKVVHVADGGAIQVAVLEMGMDSGRPSVAIRVDLPDGRTLIAETSAALFCMAGKAISARYPGLIA